MYRISATFRISAALVCLTACVLVVASTIGVVPNRRGALIRGRSSLCEAVAIHCSVAADRGDMQSIEASLTTLVLRNSDIRSAALLSNKGEFLVDVGSHSALPSPSPDRDGPSVDIVRVPLVAGGEPWGVVELAFRPLARRGAMAILTSPTFKLVVFVSSAGCLAYFLYLQRILQHLNPSKVIPQRVRATLDTFAEGLLVLDAQQRIVLANQSFANTVGEPVNDLQGRCVADLPWMDERDDGEGDEDKEDLPWSRAVREQTKQTGSVLRLQDRSQQSRTFTVNAAPILSDDGSCHGALASFDDVTELQQRNTELKGMLTTLQESREQIRQQNEELQLLATRDPLTSCLNRRAFFELFETQFAAARRYGHPLSCVIADVDHFKSVNDQFGHSVGDQVLKKVAAALSDAIRDSDTICRYGGEEFCVLLPHLSVDQAKLAGQRYRQALADTDLPNLSVTASFGVSEISYGAADPQQLLDQADQALYVAKQTGRDRVTGWNEVPEDYNFDHAQVSGTQPVGENDEEVAIPFHAVTALASALRFRDADTAEHSRRVADLCVATANGLMSPSDVYILEIAALLHDIGKIGVPDSILLKPGKLTQQEWKIMNSHDRIGVEIIQSTFACEVLTGIVRNHHAIFAGNPVEPDLPKGKEIPLGARILTISDAYDAMISDRVYRKGSSQELSFAELRRCAGRQFDPELVERFIETVTHRDQNRRTEIREVSQRTALQIGMQIESLAVALENRNIEDLRALAGRLKTTANKYGISQISEVASELEESVSEDADWMILLRLTNDLLELCRSTQRSKESMPTGEAPVDTPAGSVADGSHAIPYQA